MKGLTTVCVYMISTYRVYTSEYALKQDNHKVFSLMDDIKNKYQYCTVWSSVCF